MSEHVLADYFYGDESQQFQYFRIPRLLITSPRFRHLSTEAKLLYGMMLDRMSLSVKNEWYDEDGRVYGRPPIDPVVLVKYLLVSFLYGIPSERQIEQRMQTDVALRWYLGLDLFERVPDHSTISQLRRRKPSFWKVLRRLFEEVVRQCVEKGLVSGKLAVTDSTHVKANASRRSEYLVELREEPGVYWERLDAYEEEGLEELVRRTGKRRKKRTKQLKKDRRRTHKRVSRTDLEAGHMKRPGKPRGQYYLSHQTTDAEHGIITGLTVTSGDVYDSVPYLEQLEYIHKNVIPIQAAAADSAYDFPLAHRVLEEHGIDFFVRPQPAHDRTKAEVKRDAFSYDEAQDVYICPSGRQLKGKIRHMGFSFHDSAELLDQILTENPDVEFVQIILNYFDWDSYFIQSKACYEVIRKHGKQVVVMEPVKGGVLAENAAQALRYAASKDGVLTVLSGMSNMVQMEENVATMRDFQPLTAEEEEKLLISVRMKKEQGPLGMSDFRKYESLRYHSIPVASLLDGYNSCMVQPNPSFAGELNYLANELLKLGVTDLKQPFPEETVKLDGEDVTATVKEAWDFLIAHSFAL